MASEFIPTSYYPPTGASAEQSTVDNDDMLTILDILEGFDRQSSIEDPVLVEAADMLITTTIYPGTYDDCLLEFSETIKTVTVSDTVLQDIGEMLIQWVHVHVHSLLFIESCTCTLYTQRHVYR